MGWLDSNPFPTLGKMLGIVPSSVIPASVAGTHMLPLTVGAAGAAAGYAGSKALPWLLDRSMTDEQRARLTRRLTLLGLAGGAATGGAAHYFSQPKQAAIDYGSSIPVGGSAGLIMADPILSPTEKGRALDILQEANDGRWRGLVSVSDLARAAVDTGVGASAGYVLGALLGLSPRAKSRLSRVGAIGSLLANTGVLRL